MLKKAVAAALAAVMLTGVSAAAESDITVTINGAPIEFDVQPQIINDRTMVPMRKIFNELGADVQWIDEYQMILASKGDKLILMQIGKKAIITRDLASSTETRTELDTAPVIVEDRTLIPIRAVAESLDKRVEWIDETRTVVIE